MRSLNYVVWVACRSIWLWLVALLFTGVRVLILFYCLYLTPLMCVRSLKAMHPLTRSLWSLLLPMWAGCLSGLISMSYNNNFVTLSIKTPSVFWWFSVSFCGFSVTLKPLLNSSNYVIVSRNSSFVFYFSVFSDNSINYLPWFICSLSHKKTPF